MMQEKSQSENLKEWMREIRLEKLLEKVFRNSEEKEEKEEKEEGEEK